MNDIETNLRTNFLPKQRPIDVVIQRVQPMEAMQFVKGCQTIFDYVVQINPDVIFFPERGAGPINWTLDSLGSLYGKKYIGLPLPLGTHIEIETGKESGLSKGEKRMVVEDGIKRTMELHGPIRRPLLIDEAQSGSTILTAAHFLYNRLQITGMSEKLYVIVAQDSRNGWLTNKRAHGFRTLVSNRRPHIQAEIVELPLLYTDRQIFLNHILYSIDEDPLQRPLRQKIVQNTDAMELVSNLALATVSPKDFERALASTISDQIPELDTNEEDKTVRTSLSQWMRSLLVSGNENSHQANREAILNWFLNYKICLNS